MIGVSAGGTPRRPDSNALLLLRLWVTHAPFFSQASNMMLPEDEQVAAKLLKGTALITQSVPSRHGLIRCTMHRQPKETWTEESPAQPSPAQPTVCGVVTTTRHINQVYCLCVALLQGLRLSRARYRSSCRPRQPTPSTLDYQTRLHPQQLAFLTWSSPWCTYQSGFSRFQIFFSGQTKKIKNSLLVN